MYLASGATDITDWTVGHDGGWAFVWWMTEPGFLASDGERSLSLDGNQPEYNAWVEQTLPTEAGKKYRVSFDYSSDGNGGPSHTKLFIDNVLIGEVNHGSGDDGGRILYPDLDWDTATFEFVASGPVSVLRLYDATLDNYNTIVDNVVVVPAVAPVPEASTMVSVTGLAFAVACAVASRRHERVTH